MSARRTAASGAVILLVAGCSMLATSPAAAQRTTCAEWLSMHESPRADLATTIIDAESLLEAVREIQHEGPAVAKAALVRDVVASISKNCDVMGESDQLITNLTIQMYGGGAAVDWHPGAPTPQRAPTPGTP